jgi:hypothetical protein
MTTRDRTWSTAARHIVHLCRHEVHDQRAYLAAWVALVLVHPMAASVNWLPAGAPRVALVSMALPCLRVLLMAIVVGSMVHGDSPRDELAFWRTRPIAPARIALSKWLVVVLAFVLLPTAVVCAVALSVHVPAWHWPAMIMQVLLTEGAITGLVLVLATRTRHIATLLLTTTAALAAFVLLLNSLEQLRRVPWMRERDLMADSALATGAGLGLIAAAAAGLLLVAYRGHAARRSFAVGVLAAVVGLVAPWFAPALRATRPTPFSVDIDVSAATVRAEHLGPRDGRIGLVVEPRVGNLRGTDTAEVFLLDGWLHTPYGTRGVRQRTEPRHVAASADRPQAPLVAVLDAATFASLAGRPVRFDGQFNVDVTREETVATARLEAERTLVGDASYLRLEDVGLQASYSDWRSLATGMHVQMRKPGVPGGIYEFRLRDADGSCVTRSYPQMLVPFQTGLVLPTLSRPFSVHQVALAVPPSSCTPDLPRTIVEMRRKEKPPPSTVRVTFSFVVPATAGPPRVVLPPPR